ncbi:MAG: hypothetical protein JWP88_2145 [Flaviaesturariibacter sp.]|nr:hypothetical protein [Flaviaesturariibacter sp.]
MTVPVIRLLLEQHPQLQITYVSTAFVKPLFQDIERVQFHVIDPKGAHNGIAGLYRLKRELQPISVDAIADLHNVLRTKLLRGLFLFKKSAVIDKGRKEKAELTRVKGKILRPLKTTFQRYADVFAELGLPVRFETNIITTRQPHKPLQIGIAPFAKHVEKSYPLEQMKEVVRMLNAEGAYQILLFGGKEEAGVLAEWEAEFTQVESQAGKVSFADELGLIQQLDVMVSMDSANMHLASLFNVPVVSIWGSTHPYAGFFGWGQDPQNIVQVDLYCRPCSVFGNRKCYRGDLACLLSINPVTIYDRIMQVLYKTGQA